MDFGKNFYWGTATASYQIEGARREDDRSDSIWDTFSHKDGAVVRGENGDTACDHYHRLEEDLDLVKGLGCNAYRFSVSWPRLLPDGTGKVNEKGAGFYSRMVDGLLERGITPFLTLYHWDLPQGAEDRGGWLNRDCAEWFADYAEIIFRRFSDRVPFFATLNEPIAIYVGYALGGFAPGKKLDKLGKQAAHNALLAHGKAVERFRGVASKNSNIGIVVDIWQRHPARDDNAADIALAQKENEESYRFFLNPVFKGRYTDYILEKMEREGTLPQMKDADFKLIGQKLDYFGLNCYNRVVVSTDTIAIQEKIRNAGGNFSDSGDELYPRSIYDALHILKDDYNVSIPVIISENGTRDESEKIINGKIHDGYRIRYIQGFLEWLHKAITEGIDVRGYYLWTLIDNFEWTAGYDFKFGIVSNDRETQRRNLKDSALFYSDVVKNNRIVVE